ncbi:hypothetical protein GPDM_07225 [Planococcus donghaensis MPA1U2]|uniref:Uncharacterized protein n=1 Tax=Planococcus donghaensis MPA1U2 TaxID=933115 RepID=E7RG47_9BACL|nr:hypothetical protein [Planococcus donghaensis]EGA90054.1 hypothetical protein GPDM_07225 [Planococcus donghaensis MPA1U2]
MTKDSQGKNTDHQKDENDSTVEKIIEKTSEMLGGGDEGWESPAKAEPHKAPNESPDYVPSEDKVVRDPNTGEKKIMKDK